MSSENLDFVDLESDDELSSADSESSLKSTKQQTDSEQSAPMIKQLDDSVFILSRADRDSIVANLIETSPILQGDETLDKEEIGYVIDDLLVVLSGLPFKSNDADATATNGGLAKVVFDLTQDEKLKTIRQLVNIKSYAIMCVDLVSNEIKNSLLKESQELINLLLFGLPARVVKWDAGNKPGKQCFRISKC